MVHMNVIHCNRNFHISFSQTKKTNSHTFKVSLVRIIPVLPLMCLRYHFSWKTCKMLVFLVSLYSNIKIRVNYTFRPLCL
ncbi:hypothetical protein Hanom_Chr10g00887341 [Helianthus anomalus]